MDGKSQLITQAWVDAYERDYLLYPPPDHAVYVGHGSPLVLDNLGLTVRITADNSMLKAAMGRAGAAAKEYLYKMVSEIYEDG